MSQMPLLSSSLRLMGMDGRKWPSRPVVPSAGISQIRKKPSTWSMRYAWKYLRRLKRPSRSPQDFHPAERKGLMSSLQHQMSAVAQL